MPLTSFYNNVGWDEFRPRSRRPAGIYKHTPIKTCTVAGSFSAHQRKREDCRDTSMDIEHSVDRSQTCVKHANSMS